MPQCRQCHATFPIYPEDKKLYGVLSVPEPSLCPTCRFQRRLAWRNDLYLYARTCDKCQSAIVSMYHPTAPFPVYCSQCWYSDQWNGDEYGRAIDWSRSLFEQLAELQAVVPRLAVNVFDSDNCDYSNYMNNAKDSYLCFGSGWLERCYYNLWTYWCQDSLNNYNIYRSELVSDCLDCEDSYHLIYCRECLNCTDCDFCTDCRGCHDCFGCVNLRNSQYCWFNEQLSADEYRRRRAAVDLTDPVTYQEYATQAAVQAAGFPVPFARLLKQNENVTGDHLVACRNVYQGFDTRESEDVRYLCFSLQAQTAMDCSFYGVSERNYECLASGYNNYSQFVNFSGHATFSYYVDLCQTVQHCSACIGLKNTAYCILNKRYEPDEYQQLSERLRVHYTERGEWGEFFPVAHSPFSYHETAAQRYFPLSAADVQGRGWRWRADEAPPTAGQPLPQSLAERARFDYSRPLTCRTCRRPFKSIDQERSLARKIGVPIADTCYLCRLRELFDRRQAEYRLYHRQCLCQNTTHGHSSQCTTEFETTYPPDRPEKVYCEECYQKEIY